MRYRSLHIRPKIYTQLLQCAAWFAMVSGRPIRSHDGRVPVHSLEVPMWPREEIVIPTESNVAETQSAPKVLLLLSI